MRTGICYYVLRYCLLMLFAQQVVNGLNGIEGAKGNLDKYGAPVAHGTIPKAWQLEGLELFTSL